MLSTSLKLLDEVIYTSKNGLSGGDLRGFWRGFVEVEASSSLITAFSDNLGANALGIGGRVSVEALAGILVAHLSHLLSVLVLHDLSRTLFETHSGLRTSEFTFISAFLHIITPAGMFLSAPCAESLFSLFQFTAFNMYVRSIQAHESDATVLRDVEVIASGMLVGLATTMRSNGILSGLIFAYDAVVTAMKIFKTRNFTLIPKLVAAGYAGLLVALGAAIPQFLAYVDYCLQASTEDRRPWCRQLVPSIYGWVQEHYWYDFKR